MRRRIAEAPKISLETFERRALLWLIAARPSLRSKLNRPKFRADRARRAVKRAHPDFKPGEPDAGLKFAGSWRPLPVNVGRNDREDDQALSRDTVAPPPSPRQPKSLNYQKQKEEGRDRQQNPHYPPHIAFVFSSPSLNFFRVKLVSHVLGLSFRISSGAKKQIVRPQSQDHASIPL